MEKDIYMGLAIELAREALEDGEVPVGCVVVHNGMSLAAAATGREPRP